MLRDYLPYAMTKRIIRVQWSAAILDEVVEHLIENVGGFDAESGERLVAAMNGTFPNSEVAPAAENVEVVAALAMPDEDDRHVLLLPSPPMPKSCAPTTSSTSRPR